MKYKGRRNKQVSVRTNSWWRGEQRTQEARNRNKRQKKEKVVNVIRGKVGSEVIYYFFGIHYLFGCLLFLLFVYMGGFLGIKPESFSEVFNTGFIETIGTVFLLSLIAMVLARGLSYGILYGIYYAKGLSFKSMKELNIGINRISMRLFLFKLISAVIFSLGLIYYIRPLFFENDKLINTIAVYCIVEGLLYVYLWYKMR